MSNPLRWFRKYQNAMMWVFGVLMIIAFVFLGGMGSGVDMSDSVRPGFTGRGEDDVVATWKGGKITEADFSNLRIARNRMRTYTQSAMQVAADRGGMRGRVSAVPNNDSDGALMEMLILANKADEMGIVVDDEACLHYLEQLTDGKVAPNEFQNLWANMTGGNSSDKELLNMLRRELMAIQVRAMMQSGGYPVSPLRHWEYYNRLERRVSAEVMPIPVAKYLAKTGDPSEAELKKLFDKYKTDYNEPLTPEPGFKQRAQAAFEYIKFDFNDFYEAELASITDKEVAEYYEKNKDEFRESSFLEDDLDIPAAPEEGIAPPDASTDDAPAAPSTDDATSTEDMKPAEVETTTTTEEAAPATTEGAATTEANPVEEVVVEEDAATETTPVVEAVEGAVEAIEGAVEGGADAVPSVPGADAGSSVSPNPLTERLLAQAPDAAAAAQAVVESAPAAEAAAEVVESAVETETPATETPAVKTETETPATTATEAEMPADDATTGEADTTAAPATTAEEDLSSTETKAAAAKEKPPTYKPLEKVAPEIKRAIANPRAQEKLQKAFGSARSRCMRYYRDQVGYQINRKKDATPPPLPKLDDIATPKPLDIKGIPLCDALKISEYDLGQAYDLEIGPQGFAKIDFAQYGFEDSIPLFKTEEFPSSRSPMGGVSSAPIRYLFWKTEVKNETTPEFKDVREQVAAAWKKQKAYELALQDAEKAAEKCRAAGTPLSSACADMGSNFLDIKDVTWMSGGNVPLDDSTTPSPSPIEGVGSAGYEFYAALFSLDKGEAGVTHDQPRDNVYVVRVNEQGPDLSVRQAGFFANAVKVPGINYIVRRENQRALFNSYQDLLESENVEWKRQPRAGGQQP